jgi:hypothetical protein
LQISSSLGFSRAAFAWPDDGDVVARELVLAEQLADFHLDEVEQLLVVDEVDLVHEHHDVGTPTWRASSTCSRVCGIGPSSGRDHEDRAVHLGGAGDHVLHEVGVARAVDVGVVTVFRLVLHVRRGDRHGLVRVTDGAALGDLGVAT